jgi:ABC-type lipoprotein release transport system permease subunit
MQSTTTEPARTGFASRAVARARTVVSPDPYTLVPSARRARWQLLAYLVLAGVAGVIAALPPARRAARLNVLEAVATE